VKSISTILLVLIAGISLGGCSSDIPNTVSTEQQAIDQVAAPFSQGAITLNITAEPGLNAWNEIANSCTVLIIQAQKSSSLNKVLSNPAQLKSLFNGAGAEDDILKVDRYAAMPGQQTTLHIDRSENARQVAIVAGYYPFPKKQHMTLFSIPATTRSEGWWTKKWSAELAPLTLSITLGSQSITQIKGVQPEPVVQTQAELAASPGQSQNTPAQEVK